MYNLDELAGAVGRVGGAEIEVLAEGVRAYGLDFLRRVDGQLAAIILIGAQCLVYAVLDRFGVCPLCVAREPGRSIVASNIEAVIALTAVSRPLSLEGLAGIVADWAPTDGRTPYRWIDQVLPGHAIRLDVDAPPTRSANTSPAVADRPFDDAKEGFATRAGFRQSRASAGQDE